MIPTVFDYKTWITRYPELSAVYSEAAQLFFNEATLYCNNGPGTLIKDDGERAIYLNMLTAHIASLNSPSLKGRAGENIVGRLSYAIEGSVTATFENLQPGSASWFVQTKYGAAFWQATAKYRITRMHRARPFQMDPWQNRLFR